MSDAAARNQWVERVLAIRLPDRGNPIQVARIWEDARKQVTVQTESLRSTLRALQSPLASKVADIGLDGFGDRFDLGLADILARYDRAQPERKGALVKSVRKAIVNTRRMVALDSVIAALERNPFGVSIAIKSAIMDALRTIEDAVGSAARS
jgi:hypothetical protein